MAKWLEMMLSVIKETRYITICWENLNLERHQNCITGSRVTAILLNGWVFLLDEVVQLVGGGSVINGAYPV